MLLRQHVERKANPYTRPQGTAERRQQKKRGGAEEKKKRRTAEQRLQPSRLTAFRARDLCTLVTHFREKVGF